MKTKNLLIAMLAVVLAACGGNTSKESASTEESKEVTEGGKYMVNKDETKVAWKGEVAGVYGHNGVIDVTEGSVMTTGNQITGGEIVIDMTTIQPLDSSSYKDEEGKRATDLVGHLSTGDFFLVDSFPTASFVIKSHMGNQLTGDLTIRGNTNEEVVDLSSLTISDDGIEGEGTLVFDRQDYDVAWVHYMKDMVLSDDITLNISLKASK